MKSNLWWAFQIPTSADRLGKLTESSWLGRLTCRVLSFPTPSPPPPNQKNTSKNSSGVWFCFFLQDKSHSSINDECLFLESKQLSQTVICIPVHNGWGRELGPKPHLLPHFHCAYQIPKHILKADLWNGDSEMGEGDFAKKKELTNSHRACHSSDQTSAHWTELFTLSQESMVSGTSCPPV